MNEISNKASTRLVSGTILDLSISNIMQHSYKFSIINNHISDHGIIYTSISQKVLQSSRFSRKSKLDLNAAMMRVEQICTERTIICGDELNVALENIVNDCTTVLNIRSDHHIISRNVDGELILAIRERDPLYPLVDLYPDNITIAEKYIQLKDFVKYQNLQRRTLLKRERIDCRWRYKKDLETPQKGFVSSD